MQFYGTYIILGSDVTVDLKSTRTSQVVDFSERRYLSNPAPSLLLQVDLKKIID